MKKLKYLLLIISLTFVSFTSVNAATVSINGGSVGTSIEVPSFMTYYDITSPTSVNMLSTSSDPITLTYSTNFTTVANSYGGIMAMKVNTPFVKDFYYAITVYNWTTGSYGQLSTISTVGISDGMRNASQASLVGDGAWTLFRGIAGTAEICNYDMQTLQSFCGNATAYTFIIKATYTADAIAFPYTTSPTCNNCLNTFYGYSIDSLGSKDDGITTQDVQNAINSSNLATASDIAQVQTSIQEVKQELSSVSDSVDNLNQNITSDNVEGVQNSFESFENFISENSTITQLITMPITLYSSILNGLQSTCQPFQLGNLFGTNLTIPCINIGNYLGSALWSMIDIIISGFAIFAISKKLIKIFNNFSSMKEGDVIDD